MTQPANRIPSAMPASCKVNPFTCIKYGVPHTSPKAKVGIKIKPANKAFNQDWGFLSTSNKPTHKSCQEPICVCLRSLGSLIIRKLTTERNVIKHPIKNIKPRQPKLTAIYDIGPSPKAAPSIPEHCVRPANKPSIEGGNQIIANLNVPTKAKLPANPIINLESLNI